MEEKTQKLSKTQAFSDQGEECSRQKNASEGYFR